MTKEVYGTINDIHAKMEVLGRLSNEIADRIPFAAPNIEELTSTVERQGFTYLLEDSSVEITDMLIAYINLLDNTREVTKDLLMTIIGASTDFDTIDQQEAKQEIAKKYNDYLDSLG